MTFAISDSLSATVIVIASVLTISAKPELLEDDELELPRLPAVLDEDPVPEVPEDPEPDEPDPVEFVLELEPAEISSPGLVLSNETIVPLAGAYSFVSASAV